MAAMTAIEHVLVVNAGSSSCKLRVLDAGYRIVATADTGPDAHEAREAMVTITRGVAIDAVGHRVVHGGRRHAPALVDDALVGELDALTPLAPQHQPLVLATLAAARLDVPGAPHVACFDTAFHTTLPLAASTYAIPAEWRDLGVRRVGFHGLSHAYAARTGLAFAATGRRVVTSHLGSGASLAAVVDGRCVDTTMGFTPLDGLVMATRSGSVDPGSLLWLQREHGLTAEQVEDALERRSGLLALAGTARLDDIAQRAMAGDASATLAWDVYVHRLRAGIAAMAAAAGGVDVLVFTGGVGEHVPTVRSAAVDGLAFLGCRIDGAANARATGDALVSAPDSAAAIVVVTAREDVEIACATRALLDRGESPP